ncbi:MAG: hypothetical protein U0441_30770 [Polyangiaceae bacterium]
MIKTTTAVFERPQHGTVTTKHIEGSIVESCYTGYCSQAAVASVLALTPEVLRDVPSTRWLLDLGGVSSFDAGCRVPGGEILRLFREAGGDRFAVVVKSSALRMTLAAVAFAARLPLKLFDNRMEALSFLRERDARRSAA